MKILIVGGGGREHALAWQFSKSPEVTKIVASPGNPGIEQVATCLPAPADVAGYADVAEAHGIDLTVVGPEAPLVAGLVDVFRSRGLRIIGPTKAAAQLEGSKIFAKQFFSRAGIPTARSGQSLDEFSFPVVIKADGLAAGKGVVIAHNRDEADRAIAQLGPNLVLEEFLEGEEVSFIGLSDGEQVLPFPPTQDHKRVFDGDRGPNTGGMGAYCDSRILTPAQTGDIMERVMLPAIQQMKKEGAPFTGFLYAGLMMTADGPKILEFNVRLGDPEAQVLLHSMEGDLTGFLMGDASAAWWSKPSACVVAAAAGYPENTRTGDEITGISEAEQDGATVFQAGTKKDGDSLLTAGGRVLGVTATNSTLQSSLQYAYAAIEKIHFTGMHYRRDIGRRGLKRYQA